MTALAAFLWSALGSLVARLLTPPAPPVIPLEVPYRYLPAAQRTAGQAYQAAWLLGAATGGSYGVVLGLLLAVVLYFVVRFLIALTSLVRSGVRLADGLALLLYRRAAVPAPPPSDLPPAGLIP